MIGYEYTKGSRLDDPNKYMYSLYQGNEFLEAYFKDRLDFIKNFKRSNRNDYNNETFMSISPQVTQALEDIIETKFQNKSLKSLVDKDHNIKLDFSWQNNIVSLPSFSLSKNVNSKDLLESLLNSQVKSENENLQKFWLDLLIQKFEVTKKLYEIYPVNFQKGEGRNDIVYLYAVFSISLTLFYNSNNNLKYLNTLLKVNDLLCSIGDKKLHKKICFFSQSLVLFIEILTIKSLGKKINEVDFEIK